jgi:hypothetical protein
MSKIAADSSAQETKTCKWKGQLHERSHASAVDVTNVLLRKALDPSIGRLMLASAIRHNGRNVLLHRLDRWRTLARL